MIAQGVRPARHSFERSEKRRRVPRGVTISQSRLKNSKPALGKGVSLFMYCVKCRAKREGKEKEDVTMKNGDQIQTMIASVQNITQ